MCGQFFKEGWIFALHKYSSQENIDRQTDMHFFNNKIVSAFRIITDNVLNGLFVIAAV